MNPSDSVPTPDSVPTWDAEDEIATLKFILREALYEWGREEAERRYTVATGIQERAFETPLNSWQDLGPQAKQAGIATQIELLLQLDRSENRSTLGRLILAALLKVSGPNVEAATFGPDPSPGAQHSWCFWAHTAGKPSRCFVFAPADLPNLADPSAASQEAALLWIAVSVLAPLSCNAVQDQFAMIRKAARDAQTSEAPQDAQTSEAPQEG